MDVPCSSEETFKSSEASNVVNELLESLLDEVLSVRECDITAKGKRLRENSTTASISISKEEPNESFDIISLIRDSQEKDDSVRGKGRTVTDFTLNDSHTNILQLRCVEQMVSGYCGHYALYNALCMMEACSAGTGDEAMELIKEIASIGAYWRRYWWSISQLLERAHEEDSWPWTESYVITGDMERSFLNHLLSCDHHVTYLSTAGQGSSICVLQYAYGRIQNSFSDVCDIQKRIDAFRSTCGPAHIPFILGITNHWLSVMVYKTGEPCACVDSPAHSHTHHSSQQPHDKVSVIILDSNNSNDIISTDDDIIAKVAEFEKKRIAEKGKGYDDWRRSMYIQSHKDQRDFILKLAKCVGGKIDLRHEVSETYVRQMLDSYTQYVATPLITSGPDSYLPYLLAWLENRYPSKMLNNSLIPLATQCGTTNDDGYLSTSTVCNLKEWAELNCTRLRELALSGLPDVQLFTDVVDHVRTTLVN